MPPPPPAGCASARSAKGSLGRDDSCAPLAQDMTRQTRTRRGPLLHHGATCSCPFPTPPSRITHHCARDVKTFSTKTIKSMSSLCTSNALPKSETVRYRKSASVKSVYRYDTALSGCFRLHPLPFESVQCKCVAAKHGIHNMGATAHTGCTGSTNSLTHDPLPHQPTQRPGRHLQCISPTLPASSFLCACICIATCIPSSASSTCARYFEAALPQQRKPAHMLSTSPIGISVHISV